MPNRTHLQGLLALPEYMACLSVAPDSVDPGAELRLIVWGQLTYREGGNNSNWLKCAESLQNTSKITDTFFHNCI